MNTVMDKRFEETVNEELSRENILNKVMPRFLSKRRAETLEGKEAVLREYLGLPVGLYIPMPPLSDETSNASIVVTRAILERYDISEKEAFECAIDNMSASAEISSFASVIMGLMPTMGEEIVPDEDPGVLFVSNENRFYGAAAILCPSVLKTLSERIGGDMMILPSSVHETLVMPLKDPDMVGEFASMVREINSSTVDPAEQLSDNVFTYINGVLSVCA